MAIIVEGMDNSGKSTLAASFGLDVLHPGPRPRSAKETMNCLEGQLVSSRLPVVMDRVTAISTPAYTGDLDNLVFKDYRKAMVDTHHCVIIYCRPPIEAIKDFSRHTAVGHDEKRQIQWMIKHADQLIANYDRLMETVPHLKYDYTNPNDWIVKAAFDAVFTMGGWHKWLKSSNH
jgi:hypothetical protein